MLKKLVMAAALGASVVALRKQSQAKNEKNLWNEATTAPDAR